MSIKKNNIPNQFHQNINVIDYSKDSSNYPPENVDLFQKMVKFTNQNSPKTNKSLLDCSNTFSIKNENLIPEIGNSIIVQNINTSINNEPSIGENSSTLKEGNAIIVYNIGDDYLIPMSIVYITSDEPTLMKLKYLEDNSDIIVKKSDIFFQYIDSFVPNTNLGIMKHANELSILKNFQYRIKNNKPYIYVDDILILLFYSYNHTINDNIERDFFLEEFLQNKENEIIIYKNICSKTDNENISCGVQVIKKYLLLNDYLFYEKVWNLLEIVLKIININSKYMITYNSNDNGNHYFNFVPIFPTNFENNHFYQKNIFFKNQIPLKNNDEGKSFFITESTRKYVNSFDNDIQLIWEKLITENKEVFIFIIRIIELFNELKLADNIQNVIQLLTLAYIFNNHKDISNDLGNKLKEKDTSRMLYQIKSFTLFLNNKNLIFFSNIIILIMIKYLNLLLNYRININNTNINTSNKVKNCLLVFFNSLSNDDEILLNEILKKKTIAYFNCAKNNNSLTSFIKYYITENISNLEKKICVNEKLFFESIQKFFPLDFLIDNKMEKKEGLIYLSIFNQLYQNSIENLEIIENTEKPKKINQIWNFNPISNFNYFISDQNNLNLFFQTTTILDYIKLYQKQPNKFFKTYTFQSFFDTFLPVLSDIDTKFYSLKIPTYIPKLKSFITELQNYQNIIEPYKIDSDYIKINCKTFEIMLLLLKSIIEENIKKIQKKILSKKHKNSLVTSLKEKAKIIQRSYRRHLYSSYQKKNNNELSEMMVERYKGNDPLLILLIINSKKVIKDLIKENTELKFKINNSNVNTSKNKKLKINGFLNSSSSNRSGKQYCDSISSISYNNQNNSNRSNINSNNNHIIINNNEEIKSLKQKLNEARSKYKELVQVIVEYEKKMQNFVKLINSNREVKDVLTKNGIQIN